MYNNSLLTTGSLESYLKVLGSTVVLCSWILQIISSVVKSCKVFALVTELALYGTKFTSRQYPLM